MVLSAILKLDAGAFTTPLGKAVEGIKSAIRVGAEMGEKLQAAFDAGGALKDLQDQTGELPGTLMVLKQAFQDTDAGADSMGQTLALMRKSLAGISETGEPTGKMFQQLGLDIEGLKGMSAAGQLTTIGAAINGLKTPAEQSAAAMGIFGRSGNRMMGFLKDPGALDAAAKSLGGLPALMDRNARAFDEVSDRIGHIKAKGAGLWAGIAEGLLPLADGITSALDGIDLTGIGQRIGAFIGTTVQFFKDAPLGQTLKDGLVIGLGEAVNWGVTGFLALGGALWKALSYPLALFTAAWGAMIQGAMEMLGKIPKVGKALGLEGFQMQGFGDLLEGSQKDLSAMADAALAMNKITLVDVDAEKARMAEVWSAAADTYQAKIAAAQEKAKGNATAGTGELEATKGSKASKEFATDSLARIGIMVGAGNNNRIQSLSERTAKATEKMAAFLEKQRGVKFAWGV
jgi:hypothetical protein